MALDDAKVKELEEKFGKRIAVVRSAFKNDDGSPEWEIVLRPPKRVEYQRMRAQIHGDTATKADAQELLVRTLCVYPEREEMGRLLEEWPGIAEACGPILMRLTGAQAAADSKS